MANSLLTINMITREAVRLWKNTNAFIRNIDTQYDDSFAKTGAKIGTSLRIRLPNDFTVRTGQAASIQDTAEQSTTLVVATQQGVDVQYSSVDRTMSLDDFSERVLAPMVNNLAGAVAVNVMGGSEGGVANFAANQDASGNVLTPTASTWLQAGATLDQNSAPRGRRKIIMDPLTQARTVASLSGLFNPQSRISDQYETGEMQQALGFDWFMDQTVIQHTTGAYSASGGPPAFVAGTVAGAGQSGLMLVVTALGGPLAQGDIITIAGVNGVNRITKKTFGPRTFTVTAPAIAGATAISIYPALIPGVGGNQVQYQTVDVSPANLANISVVTLTGSSFRKNIAYAPEAITLATADLVLPRNVEEAAREVYDGCSMRMVSAYNVQSDEFITRLDILYGYLFVRPEWACEVPDII